MKVLGLDPGSRRTGYGVVERSGNRYVALDHGTIAPPARLELPQRLHAIAEAVEELVRRHAPDRVSVEEAFYHESVRSTLVLGHVRGALLVAAIRGGAEISEYSPREIKQSEQDSWAMRHLMNGLPVPGGFRDTAQARRLGRMGFVSRRAWRAHDRRPPVRRHDRGTRPRARRGAGRARSRSPGREDPSPSSDVDHSRPVAA